MSVDLSIERWTRDVAVRQWRRDDAALTEVGAALPEPIARERSLAEVHRLDLSLFVVFEEAALRVSGALVRRAPDAQAMAFAAQQTLDEARHHEMFARRLAASTGAWGRSAGGEDILIPPLRKFLAQFQDILVILLLIPATVSAAVWLYEHRRHREHVGR